MNKILDMYMRRGRSFTIFEDGIKMPIDVILIQCDNRFKRFFIKRYIKDKIVYQLVIFRHSNTVYRTSIIEIE